MAAEVPVTLGLPPGGPGRATDSDTLVTKFHRPTLTQRELTFNHYYLALARLGLWIWRTGLTLAGRR